MLFNLLPKSYHKFRRNEKNERLKPLENFATMRLKFRLLGGGVIIECFLVDEKKAYQIKRAIELSIEHYAIEMADDAECLKIIEERLVNTP
ncbi:MAG: hypothetical protein JHC37_00220 [Campylobacteraceae bacterium]|nr:hypothetical protein [Campylobacteraceae bacterium]